MKETSHNKKIYDSHFDNNKFQMLGYSLWKEKFRFVLM